MKTPPDIEALDPRAAACFLSNVYHVERIATGMRWAEGPVWFADGGYLLWSDVPSNQMWRWTEDGHSGIFRAPSFHANGNTRDRLGRLVTCEHQTRRVTRTEPDGRVVTLAERFGDRRFNSPNDVVVRRDGSIWFTDPDYGILSDYEGGMAPSEIGSCNVYRITPGDLSVSLVSDNYTRPNGLAFSPDEALLYIADSGGSHTPGGPRCISVHDVSADGLLGEKRFFTAVADGVPDGMKIDENGNVWTSAGCTVEVHAPDGVLIGRIAMPEPVSNLAFGGRHRNRLFITATSSVYAVYVAARGLGML